MPWPALKPLVFAAVMDHFASGEPILSDAQMQAADDTAIHEDDDEVRMPLPHAPAARRLHAAACLLLPRGAAFAAGAAVWQGGSMAGCARSHAVLSAVGGVGVSGARSRGGAEARCCQQGMCRRGLA